MELLLHGKDRFNDRFLPLTKLLLFMRLTAILILGASLHVSANSDAQNITISAKKITIEKVFKLIEKQTDFSFLWNEKVLDKSHTIHIDVKDASLNKVLDICLGGLPLSYKILDRVVLIELLPVLSAADSAHLSLYPPGELHGKILNENGDPLAGATIHVKDATVSAVTDDLGNFQINTGDQTKPVLEVSFVGYLTENFPVRGRNNFTIRLRQDQRAMGDVVIIGYGEQRKKDVTGSISTVKSEEIAKRPLVRVEQALQGTAAGVAVQSANGMPGAPLSVRIRGVNSITGSNEPLYVIDGYIGGSIETVSPSDIESLEILKDASASAIYGSRASNGVVLITTKSGHEGSSKINVNAWFQKAAVPKELDLMNAYDFANTLNTQNASTGLPPAFSADQLNGFKTNSGTDWQKALQQKPLIQNYEASVSGGSPHLKYFVSFNYLNQPGLILNQYYKRGTLRSNLDFKINDKLDLKFYVVTAIPTSRNTAYGGDTGDPFAAATEWDPTKPVRDPLTGKLTITSQYGTLNVSPVAQSTSQKVDANTLDAIGTGVLTYHILKNLTFTSSDSYESQWGWTRQLFGLNTSQTVVNGISSGYSSGNTTWNTAFQTSNFLTYNLKLGEHAVTLTGLYEYQQGT
ncbi:MAG TPA: SusC/RagA family TonB-linked outer membrane protein, partial [Puia sp.]|nr:SusC/RagA family TonB-linked outer membrane protein [Puia sp.]